MKRRKAAGWVMALLCMAGCAARSASSGAVMDIGSSLQLFVDGALVDSMRGVSLRLHHPVPREVCLTLDAPWEGPESAYATVMQDHEGRYRLYYRGGGESTQEVTCVAFSADGIHWERPSLGLYDFEGSRANNIVFRAQGRKSYGECHNFTPFLDTNPAARPEERYKAIALGKRVLPDGDDVHALGALVSPDGLRWSLERARVIITEGRFDSQNLAFWDTVKKRYACYLRDGREYPGGVKVRSVRVSFSDDFRTWTHPEWLDFGDSPPEHFYTNAIGPYHRNPGLYLGFPMRFVPERTSIGDPPRRTDGLSDAVLISSRDGLRFDRTFMEAFIRPGLDPLNWGNAHGNQTPAAGLLQLTPEEVSIYWLEHYGGTPRIRRGTLRTDGFVSVNAPYSGGELVTVPLTFRGSRLVLNCSTSAVGSIRVELQSADGRPLKGFSLEDCAEIYGDEIERAVSWKGGSPAALTGEVVRLRFVMKDADLYSFRFAD